jgi:uncharacterized protein YecE (DUF72 family)
MAEAGGTVIIPEGVSIGVPVPMHGAAPEGMLAEMGADFADLPAPASVRKVAGRGTPITLISSLVITHRRSDPRYKAMANPPPEHAAVGHFERSRWTDEAWTATDDLARAVDAQAVVLQTPASFKASSEHATRLENFLAHAMRPGVAIAWEWARGSWPERKALDLCERIGAIPVVDPGQSAIPESEFVYLRFTGPMKRHVADDDLKETALQLRDRIGWVVFSNPTGTDDAGRLTEML